MSPYQSPSTFPFGRESASVSNVSFRGVDRGPRRCDLPINSLVSKSISDGIFGGGRYGAKCYRMRALRARCSYSNEIAGDSGELGNSGYSGGLLLNLFLFLLL